MQVSLSRDSWHYRLQNKVFGYQPEIDNLCPYFWLTIFSMVVIGPVLVGKLAMRPIGAINDILSNWVGRYVDRKDTLEQYKIDSIAESLDDATIYHYLMILDFRVEASTLLIHKVRRIMAAWRQQFSPAEYKAEVEIITAEQSGPFWERYTTQKKYMAERKARLHRIALLTQKAAFVLLGCVLASAVGFLTVRLILLFIAEPISVVVAVGVVALGMLIGFGFKKRVFDRPLDVATTGVSSAFGLFSSYFMAVKEKTCPHIEWVLPKSEQTVDLQSSATDKEKQASLEEQV